LKLENITTGAIVRGVIPNQDVTVISSLLKLNPIISDFESLPSSLQAIKI